MLMIQLRLERLGGLVAPAAVALACLLAAAAWAEQAAALALAAAWAEQAALALALAGLPLRAGLALASSLLAAAWAQQAAALALAAAWAEQAALTGLPLRAQLLLAIPGHWPHRQRLRRRHRRALGASYRRRSSPQNSQAGQAV